jgi:hypothetical protein
MQQLQVRWSAARANDFRIRRHMLEDGLLHGIRRELLEPEVLAEFKRRVLKRLAEHERQPAVNGSDPSDPLSRAK